MAYPFDQDNEETSIIIYGAELNNKNTIIAPGLPLLWLADYGGPETWAEAVRWGLMCYELYGPEIGDGFGVEEGYTVHFSKRDSDQKYVVSVRNNSILTDTQSAWSTYTFDHQTPGTEVVFELYAVPPYIPPGD